MPSEFCSEKKLSKYMNNILTMNNFIDSAFCALYSKYNTDEGNKLLRWLYYAIFHQTYNNSLTPPKGLEKQYHALVHRLLPNSYYRQSYTQYNIQSDFYVQDYKPGSVGAFKTSMRSTDAMQSVYERNEVGVVTTISRKCLQK